MLDGVHVLDVLCLSVKQVPHAVVINLHAAQLQLVLPTLQSQPPHGTHDLDMRVVFLLIKRGVSNRGRAC